LSTLSKIHAELKVKDTRWTEDHPDNSWLYERTYDLWPKLAILLRSDWISNFNTESKKCV